MVNNISFLSEINGSEGWLCSKSIESALMSSTLHMLIRVSMLSRDSPRSRIPKNEEDMPTSSDSMSSVRFLLFRTARMFAPMCFRCSFI